MAAKLLIGYDVESAAVGEGLARFLGPGDAAIPSGARPGGRAARGLEVIGPDPHRARGPGHPLHLRPDAPPLARPAGAGRGRDRTARRAAAHVLARRLPRCDVRRRRAAACLHLPESSPVVLREELAITSEQSGSTSGRLFVGAPHAVRLLPGPARPARPCWTSSPGDGTALRQLVGPKQRQRQSGPARGAAVPVTRRRAIRACSRSPSSSGSTAIWFDTHGWVGRHGLPRAPSNGAIDEVAERDLVYGACFPRLGGALGRGGANGLDPGCGIEHARERGVEVLSYTEYWASTA